MFVGLTAAAAVPAAAAKAAGSLRAAAQTVVAPLDFQGKAVYQRGRNFFAGRRVNKLGRRAGNLHVRAALLLGKPLLVNETHGFVFVHRQDYRLLLRPAVYRKKGGAGRKGAYPSAFFGSWQSKFLHVNFWYIPINCIIPRFCKMSSFIWHIPLIIF
ncbi:hypothetical protein SDC9_127883 [bioreactor metagenome]|uniref:Uncharacterized protein n=1 Tax=bioreactor metagenome TaxID=1076179 RepID=A0A645CVV5_9ZZZZ